MAPTTASWCYRTSRNEVTSDSALVPFGRKGFANSLAVTLLASFCGRCALAGEGVADSLSRPVLLCSTFQVARWRSSDGVSA